MRSVLWFVMKRRILFSRRCAAAVMAVIMMMLAVLPVFADDESAMPAVEHAQAAILYNLENNRILYEYNASDTVYPTSTVKIMTAIVAMEHFEGALDTKITVTKAMLDEVSGNRIGFSQGEVVTVEQMLNCMLVNSANDAAIILAHAVAGSTLAFVNKMNEKAAWIGAYNTSYTNPTGMHHDDMVTTARDTALIAKYAYSLPGFIDITSTPKYVMEATNYSTFRSIYNRNCMISKYYSVDYYYSRALGMNAGATTQGGYAIAAAAEDAETGLTYIAVILGAESVDDVLYNYVNAEKLLEWAFDSYGYVTVLSTKKMICELGVNLSSTLDYVTLVPEKDITVYMPTSIDVSTDIRYSYNTYSDTLDAPVEAGQNAGTITVLYGDEIIGSCGLITTSSITRSEFLYRLAQISEFTKTRFFRGTLIAMVVFSILYVIAKAAYRERKLRRVRGEWRRS